MLTKRTLASSFLALAFVFTGLAAADPPAGYYDTVNTSSPALLRSTLHAVIDDHQRFPYTSSSTDTWNILESADEDPNNSSNILDVYKNMSILKFGGGTGLYNREHTWPNSYGFPSDGSTNYPYTDCHHLFLCDVTYNSHRGNLPYRDCNAGCTERVTVLNDGAGGGSGVYPGNSNWHNGSGWQTWSGRKGDVARAMFYMDVRYEGGTHGTTGAAEPDLILTDNPALILTTGGNAAVAYMGILTDLIEWNAADPPDDKERRRNDIVYSYQGNRNPFIDHPEWVGILFGGVTGVGDRALAATAITTIQPNPMRARSHVAYTLAVPGRVRVEVFSADGRRVRTLVDDWRPAGAFDAEWNGTDAGGAVAPSGVYFIRLQTAGASDTRRVARVR